MASEHITTTFTSQSQNILHTLDNKDNGQQSTRTTTSQPQQTHNDKGIERHPTHLSTRQLPATETSTLSTTKRTSSIASGKAHTGTHYKQPHIFWF